MKALIAILCGLLSVMHIAHAIDSGWWAHWMVATMWAISSFIWIVAAYLDRRDRLFNERADKFLK